VGRGGQRTSAGVPHVARPATELPLVAAARAARREARRAARLGARQPRGAALVTASGEVVSAPELPDPGDGTGGCAERTAILRAVLAGHRRFRLVCLAGGPDGGGDAGPPCGPCLQILFEFAPALPVHWGTARRPAGGRTVRELLPGAFGPRSLVAARSAGRTRTRTRSRPSS
jgi:cytidine deaminase